MDQVEHPCTLCGVPVPLDEAREHAAWHDQLLAEAESAVVAWRRASEG